MGKGAGEVTDQDRADDMAQDPEVERLVEDIEETRNDMTGTVEEIGDRLDPRNIVADAKETVRSATVGKVEDMANTATEIASDATQTVREAGTGIMDRVTSNPIPAAMVALGAGWLLLSGRSTSNRPNRSTYARSSWRDDQWSNGPGAMEQAQRRMGELTDGVERKVGEAADTFGQLADEVPYRARTAADDLTQSASQMFYSNPLAVGAIAVAVGTAVGLAMPATEMERRTLAEPARQAIGKAEEAASDALEQVEQQARDVEQQALDEDRQARAH